MQRKIEIADDTQTFRVFLDGVSRERIDEISAGTCRLACGHGFEVSTAIVHDEQAGKGEITLTNVDRVSDEKFERQKSLFHNAFYCYASAVVS